MFFNLHVTSFNIVWTVQEGTHTYCDWLWRVDLEIDPDEHESLDQDLATSKKGKCFGCVDGGAKEVVRSLSKEEV